MTSLTSCELYLRVNKVITILPQNNDVPAVHRAGLTSNQGNLLVTRPQTERPPRNFEYSGVANADFEFCIKNQKFS